MSMSPYEEVVDAELVDDDDTILTTEIFLDDEEMWRSFEVTREILRGIAEANGKGRMTSCDCSTCETARME